MSQSKWKLQKLACAIESSFGVDPSSSGSAYTVLHAMEDMTFQPSVDIIEREAIVNDMARQAHVIGTRRGTLAFKLYLKASGTPAASAVAAIAAEADPILQSVLGTVVRGTGGIIQAASTTTVVNVVTGTNFSKGMMVRVQIQDDSFQTRFIQSISSNALTLNRALSSAAKSTGIIYASSRYTRANTGHVSLSFNAIRHGIEYTFTGCKAAVKVTGISARGSVLLDVTAECADWTATTKASLPTVLPTGITAVRAPAVKGAPFAIGGTEEPMYTLEFDPGCKFEFVESTAGGALAGGDGVVAGMELVDAEPQGNIKSFFKSQHFTDFIAGTEVAIDFSCGDQTTGWGLYIPKAQYTASNMENHMGMVGENLPFMVNDNGTDAEFYLCVF